MNKKQANLITENVPSIDYTMRITKDVQDWAGYLASKIDGPIQLATVNCTQTEYHGFVLVRSKFEKTIIGALKDLKRKKLVKEFEVEGKDDQYLTIYVNAGEPRVCYNILQNKFELLTPVIVDKDSEVYRIRAYDKKKSSQRFTSLLSSLAKSKVHIEALETELTVPDKTWAIPYVKFDDDALKVIDHLSRGNYFDPQKRNITQKEISKKSGISVGKVNEVIRYIEQAGFTNLLASHPDLKQFKFILHSIMEEEKQLSHST